MPASARDPEVSTASAGQAPVNEPHRAAAGLGGTVARVLGLQQVAGNRAVAALVARQSATATATTTSSTTDPRLHYRGAGVPDTPGLGVQALPYDDRQNPLNGWDWRTILDRLTQHDEASFTFSDEVRCGANAALAIAIMHGPRSVLSFAAHVERIAHSRQGALGRLGPHPTAAQTAAHERALDNLGAEAGALFGASAIANGFGTYESLNDIAHAAKVAMTANARGFSTGTETAGMAAAAGPTTNMFLPVASRVAFAGQMATLQSGEAFIVHVDTDVLAEGAATAVGQGNHFVVVGQEPGDFGNHFLYDPYPRDGRQFTTSLSDDFWTLFETPGGTWKWVMIVSKTRPPGS